MLSLRGLMISDLGRIYREIGVPVVYGSVATFGLLDHEPTEALSLSEGRIAVQDTTLTLRVLTSKIGILKNNTVITADGTAYKILKFIPLDDGLEMKLWLSEVG